MKHDQQKKSKASNPCNSPDCSCGSNLNRRDFLALTGLGAAGALASGLPVMAGPFDESDYTKLIPADKKLDPEWVASLFARGEPTVYNGEALKTIGMPVGGICSGQLYLGGDGRLWLFDIFNQFYEGVMGKGRNGENYVNPLGPTSPIDQGFAMRVAWDGITRIKALDRSGFEDVRFSGAYPVGKVDYKDDALPVTVSLEAFSPFIPLDAANSSYPATLLQYTIKNTSSSTVEAEIMGWLQNGICIHHDEPGLGVRRNRITRGKGITLLECSAEQPPKKEEEPGRPDILFDNFEKTGYDNWTVTGTAFGDEPIVKSKMPAYQGDVGSEGDRLVNTHNTRQGEDVRGGDQHTGTLVSRPFTIERNYVTFLIGGGAHQGKTCVNLIVDGAVARTATGKNDNRMQPHSFDVRDLLGKRATIQVKDDHSGGWGNIGIDDIVFSDEPRRVPLILEELSDFGTMGLSLIKSAGLDTARAAIPEEAEAEKRFEAIHSDEADSRISRPFGEKLTGALSRKVVIKPGREAKATFLVTWHFPNLKLRGFQEPVGREYASRFSSARAVAEHVSKQWEPLARQTRLWVETWYDSSLPYWFLDRTFANASTLATSTVYRFANGRFYGWEGVGCCPGTCTHVWHYAQAVGRLFPELERDLRERVDFGIAFNEKTGVIGHRGEMYKDHPAHDGQAGNILRALREHQMSADNGFLERNWKKIKKALAYLIDRDRDFDGLIEGAQPNTLDAAWYGKIAWLNSLYLAALRAGEEMAREMKDNQFAQKCRGIFERGREQLVRLLWNGEYFIQIPDPEHMDAIGADTGCYIDQVFGQSWAHQVGLGRLYSEKHVKGALQSLWKYNFAPDVGPFKAVYKKGRPYALAGDGGLIMCTWPKGGKRKDWEKHWQFMYFNECMSGFEYQVAGHMIREGMVKEGLAVTRAIHDRYSALLRNPYNEIECSDHYARAMASYGVFLAACGYEYHGPRGHLGFAPRLTPEAFRAAFTAAEGWGAFSQKRSKGQQQESIEVRWGRLRLRTLSFVVPDEMADAKVQVTAAGAGIKANHLIKDGLLRITLSEEVTIEAGESLEVTIA